jgi:APA family basic amino acid/polyamine antiporter
MRQDKELGFWMSTALVVGNIIGMGIFLLPASLAPYGYNALLGWGITVAGMAVLARVFARLAREFPRADGPYAYIRDNVGDAPAFVAIWCYWVSLWVTNATLAVGVVGYLGAIFPALNAVPPAVLALVLIWVFVGVCLLGTRTGGGVQVVTTALKLLPMFAVIGLGLWVLLKDPGAYTRTAPTNPVTLKDLMAASTIALFAMLGIESATVPAGRVRDPERTIPRATLAGTFLTAAIYIGVSTVALMLIPQAELAKSTAPFVDLLDRYARAGSGTWLAVFVVISGLGALNGWTLLTGELTRSMAAHHVMPRALMRLNGRGAPALALVVTGFLASAMVLMNYSKSLVEGFTFLTLVVTAANLPLYFFAAIALALYWRRGGRTATVDMLVLGVLGTVYSVFAFIGIGQEPFLWSLVLAAAGLPLYFWIRRGPQAAGGT